MESPQVAIVGGGIGGAALAASLVRQGLSVRIFERATEFREIGAGVQMTPNAVKVLRALGLSGDLDKVCFRPESIVGRNWRTGRTLFRTRLDERFSSLYDAPYVQVHRADLLELLTTNLPEGITTFGAEAVSVANVGNRAEILFSDGRRHQADLVVGADGVRSVVQASLFTAQQPRYTGNMCFRALVPTAGPVEHVSPDNSVWMGPHGHVVSYYVNAGRNINIVAVVESPEWVEEGWNVASSREELLSHFVGWHPDVVKLFSQVSEVYRWGLFDRDPLPNWSSGAITLLGDAAHPMLPFLSQGAAMAIEDAYVLAASIAANPRNIGTALAAYEKERRPRTSRVQLESRMRGETYHLPSAWSQIRRDLEYRLRSIFAPQTTGIRADWVYEYDAVAAAQTIQK